LHNIGNRIATQIWEIVQTGDLEKLNELNKRQDLVVIKTFISIHGVGPTTAQGFYAQGYRSIEDLKTKAKLNNQQKIGLKYYDDLLVRIPRYEVMNIENKVSCTR
jgi:DNA polymerase lambda